jgi:EAL domain-containing protein (putative c-di-GMP-specific phosphodiesterase class I)
MSIDPGLAQSVLTDATDPLTVMRRVVEHAIELIPSAEGAVVELAGGGALTIVCAAGSLHASTDTRVPLRGSLAGLALSSGRTVRCDDAATDDRVHTAICERVGAISLLCVPLWRDGETVGVLTLTSSRSYAFEDDDVALLDRVARFISDAIAAWADVAHSAATALSTAHDAGPSASRAGPPGRELAGAERVSAFVANVLQPGTVDDRDLRLRVQAVLNGRTMNMRFQPIIDLKTGRLTGCEALARFPGSSPRPPDVWFADAHQVGLGAELQLAAIELALQRLPDIPPDVYLAVNVGHDIMGNPELLALLGAVDARRVVVELTEHLQVQDYPSLIHAIGRIRDGGTRLAIDDTGAGFAGFAHILKLAPDLIKLDRVLTTGIDTDPARRALGGALVSFASATSAKIIAEGIETAAELDTIRELGIEYGQGHLLGRPAPLPELLYRNRLAADADGLRAGVN